VTAFVAKKTNLKTQGMKITEKYALFRITSSGSRVIPH
jgi:hypothetical protein